jgi:nucleotide-binding universal stress UspA family protein
MIPYRKILIPLDGSALANQALVHARILAASLRAELVLFRAVEEVGMAVVRSHNAQLALELDLDRQPALLKQARKELEKTIELLEMRDLKPQVVVEMGEPAEAIVNYARANPIDLIVMSTHGRSGLARLVYGSVAEKLLHLAPCPVLLIRAQADHAAAVSSTDRLSSQYVRF